MHTRHRGRQQGQEQGSARHGAERTCIGCRAQREKHHVVRFACTSQGVVILDVTGRAPGRGAHVCCEVTCLRKALHPARLAAALKQSVTVPDFEVMHGQIKQLLYRRLGACLGLGYKAGAVLGGYALLRKALAHRRVLYVILAENTATGRAEEYRSWCTHYQVPYVTLWTKEELGHSIGKPSRSALGLTEPRFLEPLCTILTSLERL